MMAAIIGMLANACQIVESPGALVAAGFYKAGGFGVILIAASGVFFVVWHTLIGFRLLKIGRAAKSRTTLWKEP